MKVLLIGSGGREHAIAIKLNQSSLLTSLYSSPGNAGTAEIGKNVTLNSHKEIREFIEKHNIDVLIIGPEKPLVEGLIDFLSASLSQKCILFGPHKSGAMLEGSKAYAKSFMNRHSIPTARHKTFNRDTIENAISFIQELNTPIVLKADGLAGGKGVIIHTTKQEAISELREMFKGKFGVASEKVVIEEYLDGIEFSVFILTNGRQYHLLPAAKDYKRIGEGDKGLNTGGMGAVSPVPFLTDKIMDKVTDKIIEPTLTGIKNESLEYTGFLFFGLILVKGEPYVIEYNCRMGDPETQAVFPRIKMDLLKSIKAIDSGNFSSINGDTDERYAVTTILASDGYPVKYKKGYEITGIDQCNDYVILAGVKNEHNIFKTDGGRVLAVTSLGKSLKIAQEKCYKSVEEIDFHGKNYRTDIGNDLINS